MDVLKWTRIAVQRIGFDVNVESGKERKGSQLRSFVWNMLITGGEDIRIA